MEKSRYQQEFDALPEWAQKMVSAVSGGGLACHGYGNEDRILGGMSSESKKEYRGFFLGLKDMDAWSAGFDGMRELACGLSAPWPRPTPPPHEAMSTNNIVEMIHDYDDEEGGGFDQPCHFGNRCGYYAVYCHNDAWPDSPRKCRRNRDDYKHEDCPGFVPNALYKPEPAELKE